MTETSDTCTIGDCGEPAARAGLCWGHLKRRQEGRTVEGALSATRSPTVSPREVLREAAIAYADVDSSDDDEYYRVDQRLRKAAESYARRATRERIRATLAALRVTGRRLGRPVSVTAEAVLVAQAQFGSLRATAKGLGVSYWAARRALRRGAKT